MINIYFFHHAPTRPLSVVKEHRHHFLVNFVLEPRDLDRTRGQMRPRVEQGDLQFDLGQCMLLLLTDT